MKNSILVLVTFLVIVLISFWWLFLEGSAPTDTNHPFDVLWYRQLVDEGSGAKPTELRVEIVGTDVAPGFAAQTGNFRSDYHTSYTSMQVVWPDRHIIVDGAVDQSTAEKIQQSKHQSRFYPESYERVIDAISSAESIWITHAHPDHVMAIAYHPDLVNLASKINMNTEQIKLWNYSAEKEGWPNLPSGISVQDVLLPKLIAPGVVLVPTRGHTPGSQSYYIQLANGQEYLLIGDIIWQMSNIESLKTRPRILQYLLFDPDEDRKAVLSQVMALNLLKNQSPDLVVLPSHDSNHLATEIKQNRIKKGFREFD